MIAHASTVPPAPVLRTSKPRPSGRPAPIQEDAAKRRAGQSYATVPASPKKGGRAIGRDRKTWERRTHGTEHSPLSRLAEEAQQLEAAGLCTAFMVVHLKANGMMAELRKRTRAEIEDELQRLYLEEQQANGCFDQVQMRDLSDHQMATPALREELRRCALVQAAKSTRIVALLDRLEEMDAEGAR